MMPAPRCPTCGKRLPKLTTVVWVEPDTRTHRTPDSRWSRTVYVPADAMPCSIADCRRLTSLTVVSVVYQGEKGAIWRFGEWDGESYWTASRPFCKPDCALAFARAAHRAGYRLNEPKAA